MALPLLLVEPGTCPNLCAAGERTIAHGHNLRTCMPHKDLAGKIDALSAVLEPAVGNATDKDGTFSAACTAQSVAAATTATVVVCLTVATIGATDGRQPSPVAIVPFHALYPLYSKTMRGPLPIGSSAHSGRHWTRSKRENPSHPAAL